MYNKESYFYGTGRRKSSVARVRLYQGTGKVTINDRDIDDYFGLETLKLIVRQPLNLTKTEGKFDIVCRVAGGGVTGQAGAIRHGVARALLQYDSENLRPTLKKAGFCSLRSSPLETIFASDQTCVLGSNLETAMEISPLPSKLPANHAHNIPPSFVSINAGA